MRTESKEQDDRLCFNWSALASTTWSEEPDARYGSTFPWITAIPVSEPSIVSTSAARNPA
jgi:hypothetical protein